MQQQPLQRQRILMRIISRVWRLWMALLVIIVAIPTIFGIWYGVQSLWHTSSLTITLNQPQETHDFAANQAITLTFSHAVNPSLLTTALHITPAHEYDLQWDSHNTTLVITPLSPWQSDTRYVLTITPDPHIASGAIMERPWYMQFTTAPSLYVETLIPTNHSADVALSSVAVMRFSQPMVKIAQLNQPVPTDIWHITPPISGTFTWIDPKTIIFRPTYWQADCNYTITSTPHLRDLQGRNLATPINWEFHTTATRINDITPVNDSQNVALSTPISFRVTGVVDANLLRNSIFITPATATTIDISAGDNESINVIITPQPQWQIGTNYQIQIGGAATTLAYQHIRFGTTPALRLIARSPGDGQILAPNQDVRFVFNTDIDTRTITDALSLTPPPLHPAQITSNGRDIRIMANWATNSQPVITIDQHLRSSTGITLSTTITSQLVIDTTSPHVMLPGVIGSIVPLSQRTGIDVTTQNITVLRLKLYALPPAILVRVLGMDNLTLQQLDPTHYNLSLIETYTITNPLTLHRVSPSPKLWQSPQSRYVLAIAQGNTGSADVRIVNILPSTLTVMNIGGHIIAGSLSTPSPLPALLTVFQDGQLIEQIPPNKNGIWMSRAYPQGQKYVLLDDSNPPDATVVTITSPPVQPPPLRVISSHTTTTIGSEIAVVVLRNEPNLPPRDARIALCDSTGMQHYAQPITFASHNTIVQARMTIPTDIDFGIYTICGDNIIDPPTLILHPPISARLSIQQQHSTNPNEYHGIITDNAKQPIANAIIYWQQQAQNGRTTSNVNGEFQIHASTNELLTIVAHTRGESVVTMITPMPQRTLRISTPQQWVQTGKYSTVQIQIIDPNNQNLAQAIKLSVKNSRGYVALRRTVMSDADGYIALDLAIPRGQWQIQASDGKVQQSHPLTVGPSTAVSSLVPEFSTLHGNDVMHFFYGITTHKNALLAQIDATGVQAMWTPIQNGVISTTIPISTTHITVAAQTANEPLRQFTTEVTTPQCIAATIRQPTSQDGKITLHITTMPTSMAAVRVQRPSDGQLVAWYPNIASDTSGTINLTLADENQSSMYVVDIRQHDLHCIQHDQVVLPIMRNQRLHIDAPTAVRIGDDIDITLTIHDNTAHFTSTLTITSTGIIRDTTPQQLHIISDEHGDHTLTIRAQITTAHPQLVVASSHGASSAWEPRLQQPTQFTSSDGFMLQGKTIINADNTAPAFDVIHQPMELFRAILNEPYDAHNPSQLAHRLWLSDDPRERMRILAQLMQIQLPNGGWGWGDTNTPDLLITSDVVSALASAEVAPASYQSAITYLKQQISNPQYSASLQALIVRALAQTGWHDATVFTRLCANPAALGNEGLAALLLVLPHDYAYAIPALLNELVSRSQLTPRGLTWSNDPASAGLHSRDSVNALILQASLRASVSTSITNQIQSMLLSSRGSGGWSDIITNARMWAMHDTLFGVLDGQQHVTLSDQHGLIMQNNTLAPSISRNEDITITSNAPVLVGITREQSPPVDSDNVRIIRRYTTNGQPLTSDSKLNIGDIINVDLDIIRFTSTPYLIIKDPLPTLGEVLSLTAPRDSQPRIDSALLTLYGTTATPSIIKYHYRVKLTHAGHISIPACIISDSAGNWYAQSQPQSLYVSHP